MKKLALIFALVFALTAGVAIVSAFTYTDQAMADCNGGNC